MGCPFAENRGNNIQRTEGDCRIGLQEFDYRTTLYRHSRKHFRHPVDSSGIIQSAV